MKYSVLLDRLDKSPLVLQDIGINGKTVTPEPQCPDIGLIYRALI